MKVKNKTKLKEEFRVKGYGLKLVSCFSKEAQAYIIDRHQRGIKELKLKGKYPTKTGDNGYTVLLGVWYFTKSRGFKCAVGKKTVWTATLLNNDLI